MFPYGYHRAPQPAEPKVHVQAETPAERRLVDAATRNRWSGTGAKEWTFRKGDTSVVVTRDALKRIPALEDQIVRQLERS